MLASLISWVDILQVLGAFWYLISIEREYSCWKAACQTNCSVSSLYCRDGQDNGQNVIIADACPVATPNATLFNFGIFLPALQNIVQTKAFFPKLFYCFWWGLQNLRYVYLIITPFLYLGCVWLMIKRCVFGGRAVNELSRAEFCLVQAWLVTI